MRGLEKPRAGDSAAKKDRSTSACWAGEPATGGGGDSVRNHLPAALLMVVSCGGSAAAAAANLWALPVSGNGGGVEFKFKASCSV